MPYGKKNKQKSYQDVLTTRLMQISLKMDDHIYCNDLISSAAAEKYLQEIASLKTTFPRANPRALQVIEKLTRCMKAILAEDKGHVEFVPASPIQTYTKTAEASSPVYSLPDEDRTELLTQVNFTDDIIDHEIIDLTEDNNNIAQDPENIVEKVKIAISKMGLQNVPEILTEDDCSQSILENFCDDNKSCNEINRLIDNLPLNVHNNPPEKELNDEGKTTMNQPKCTAIEKDCTQSVIDTFDNENTKCSEKRQERELEIYHYITKDIPVTQPIVANDFTNTYCMNNTLTTQQSKCNKALSFHLNKGGSLKVSTQASKTENKKGRRKKNKDDVTVKRKSQSKTKNTARKNNRDKPIQQGRKPFNIVLGKKVACSNIRVDKPETIYNKNVECDLSWVENLRYVREISQEENDSTLSILNDNFWNNFNLPDKWSDKEFEF